MLISVFTFQNAILLEITCGGSKSLVFFAKQHNLTVYL